ncbi:MAG: DUF3798 domain-containing protein, partial [Clostridiales bacterium]|nr:DUF3798 domain-containing protein [Clostridiales bacterium]
MKKFLTLLLSSIMVLSLAACNTTAGNADAGTEADTPAEEVQAADEAPFHIGIVTGTVSQSEDEQRGAESMIAKYGDANNGGYITHVNYPDNFSQEQETTIQQITSLADDPKMKVIIVNQGVPGTTAAFQQIRERNPDIVLLCGNSQEDTAMSEAAADLVVDPD